MIAKKFSALSFLIVLRHILYKTSKKTKFYLIISFLLVLLQSLLEAYLALCIFTLFSSSNTIGISLTAVNNLPILEFLLYPSLAITISTVLIVFVVKNFFNSFLSKACSSVTCDISSNILSTQFSSRVELLYAQGESHFIQILTGNMNLYNQQVIRSFLQLISSLFPIVFLTLTLFIVDKFTALAIITILAFAYLLVSTLTEKNIRKRAKKQYSNEIKLLQDITSIYQGFVELQIYLTKFPLFSEFKFHNKSLRNDQAYIAYFASLSRLFLESTGIITILFLTVLIRQNSTAFATISIFVFVLQKLLMYAQLAASSFSMINGNSECIEYTNRSLIAPVSSFSSFPSVTGNDVIKGIHAYQLQLEIKNLNLKVDVDLCNNRFISIEGPNGSGKTTLIKSLVGLSSNENISHQIKLRSQHSSDILDIRTFEPLNIAYCKQHASFLNGSIYSNVTMNFSEENIHAAGKDSKFMDIVELLNLSSILFSRSISFSSHLFSTNHCLSGGELQRISLARALYRDPEFLFMDESTSALDKGIECLIWDFLLTQISIKNIIYISHDPTLQSFSSSKIVLSQPDGLPNV